MKREQRVLWVPASVSGIWASNAAASLMEIKHTVTGARRTGHLSDRLVLCRIARGEEKVEVYDREQQQCRHRIVGGGEPKRQVGGDPDEAETDFE